MPRVARTDVLLCDCAPLDTSFSGTGEDRFVLRMTRNVNCGAHVLPKKPNHIQVNMGLPRCRRRSQRLNCVTCTIDSIGAAILGTHQLGSGHYYCLFIIVAMQPIRELSQVFSRPLPALWASARAHITCPTALTQALLLADTTDSTQTCLKGFGSGVLMLALAVLCCVDCLLGRGWCGRNNATAH